MPRLIEKMPIEFHYNNRQKFKKLMCENSIAIFQNNTAPIKNHDVSYPFRTDNNFFYLTGLDIPGAKLIIKTFDINNKEEILFVPPSNPELERWTGKRMTISEVKEYTGIQTVDVLDNFDAYFTRTQINMEHLYISYNESNFQSSNYELLDFVNKVKYFYPGLNIKKANLIMSKLRKIKSKEEIELIQKAIDITNKALIETWEIIKPNMNEYEVEAELLYKMLKQKSTGFGYEPIIATGINAATLHYCDNNTIMRDGEVLLFDVGAEYSNYTADISRVIPVNGKFTEEQKEVYNRVLDTQERMIDFITAGKTIKEINEKTEEIITEHLIKLGYISDKSEMRNYYMHSIGHPLGLSVHDTRDNSSIILEEGEIWTVEPGIYCYEKNFGFRIEDNIVLTKDGNINLSHDIPKKIEDIEQIVGSKA